MNIAAYSPTMPSWFEECEIYDGGRLIPRGIDDTLALMLFLAAAVAVAGGAPWALAWVLGF